jgi:hypothetical protein
MRAVMRLRSARLSAYVLPLLLGAFALRVLIPGDMAPGSRMSLESSMCANRPGRTESLKIPLEIPKPHCEQCLAPFGAAPIAFLNFGIAPAPQQPRLLEQVSQIPDSPLVRAQAARAPPPA